MQETDAGSIPGFGRSPGNGNGNPIQYSCLENPMIEETDGLQSVGSQRIGHKWSGLALTHTQLYMTLCSPKFFHDYNLVLTKTLWCRRQVILSHFQFSSVQSLSCIRLFATPWIAAHQASLSITNSRSLRKLMSIESVMPSSHLSLCHPLLLLPSIPPSIRVFSNESTLRMRWPKYWSFSFSISPSNEYSGLISFRMDCYLLAVQGTLKSLLQHHSSKASIL